MDLGTEGIALGTASSTVNEARRAALIARYEEGPRVVEAALLGITETELDTRPGPGDWSPREIVQHLADSEMTSALRLRRLLVEDEPELAGYDEEAYARVLRYADRPIGPALNALRAARATSAQLLARLAPADWLRQGTHTESGLYSVETWLELYATHAHDHAAQILRARGAPSAAADFGATGAPQLGPVPVAAAKALPRPEGNLATPVLRHGSLLVEYYDPRGHDDQSPHTRDELYVVIAGEGWFVNGVTRHRFAPHDLLFVPAGVEHRFEEFSDDFAVWVVFYGPEGGEQAG